MELIKWKKVENEEGYPCYIDETNGKQYFDHPRFSKILKTLEEFNDMKYSAYRIAFKLFALQKSLKVPPLRISSGVFARHQLSLSESSLSLDTAELEAVLADIYFAAEKEGLFIGDVDLAVDLLINLLLNVYDGERKTTIRVLAAKTILILLSEESIAEKWQALANCCADHNGCVSPRRLAALLVHVTALPKYLGCQCDHLQNDVDSCFAKSAGMLGVSAQEVAEWGAHHCSSTRWLSVVQRIFDSRSSANASAGCSACGQPLIQIKPTECLSFMKGMKRFFFCTKTRKKKTSKKERKNKQTKQSTVKRKEKPAIFTSTVGKASGNKANNPAMTLQDIITNMENDTKLTVLEVHPRFGAFFIIIRGLLTCRMLGTGDLGDTVLERIPTTLLQCGLVGFND
ncbi:jg5910 [Pararge aegeria aegeria]|uniref:Jg5910 protein n=1 Tax=Pararge aegeria aegeria TaxID=348720 RepID=A0A8S4RDG4_9NEOP|nr:jg5910 [Pararge aegeria aegeria]